jgi:hypothetical protein
MEGEGISSPSTIVFAHIEKVTAGNVNKRDDFNKLEWWHRSVLPAQFRVMKWNLMQAPVGCMAFSSTRLPLPSVDTIGTIVIDVGRFRIQVNPFPDLAVQTSTHRTAGDIGDIANKFEGTLVVHSQPGVLG